jgi:thioredoxin 2
MSHTFATCSHCHAVNKVERARALKGEAVCGKCQKPLELHGLVSHATAGDLQKILKNATGPVVVDFWASWCGPCRSYGPEFEKASVENTKAVFVKVNTETEQQLSAQLGIRGIPCTIVFEGGREIKRQAGAMDARSLNQWIGI